MKNNKEFIDNIDDLDTYLAAKEAKEKIFFIGILCALLLGVCIVYYKYNKSKSLEKEKIKVESQKERLTIQSDSLKKETVILNNQKDSLVEDIQTEVSKYSQIIVDTVNKIQTDVNIEIKEKNKILKEAQNIIKIQEKNIEAYQTQYKKLQSEIRRRQIDVPNYNQSVNTSAVDTAALRKIKILNTNSQIIEPEIKRKNVFINYSVQNQNRAKQIYKDLKNDNTFNTPQLKPVSIKLPTIMVIYYYDVDKNVAERIGKRYNIQTIKRRPSNGLKPGIIHIWL